MAKANRTESVDSPSPAKTSKKIYVIAIATITLVLVLGGGAVLALIRNANYGGGDVDTKAADTKIARHDEEPIFVRFEPFTVKLQSDQDSQEQYLQLLPEVRVLNSQAVDKIKSFMPELRDRMLMVLMSKKASSLLTPDGIETLATDLRNKVDEIIDGQQKTPLPTDGRPRPDDSVQEVVFTSFIIQ